MVGRKVVVVGSKRQELFGTDMDLGTLGNIRK